MVIRISHDLLCGEHSFNFPSGNSLTFVITYFGKKDLVFRANGQA